MRIMIIADGSEMVAVNFLISSNRLQKIDLAYVSLQRIDETELAHLILQLLLVYYQRSSCFIREID